MKQLSVFENPGNLVLTHCLDGHTGSLLIPDIKANFNLEQCPGILKSKLETSNPVFKTEKLGNLAGKHSSQGLFSDNVIFLPTEQEPESPCAQINNNSSL